MKKFFDSVDQEVLLKILSLRIKDSTTLNLLKEIIFSYTSMPAQKIGMPIGNLTSQIFANIYLNELDRFVKHRLKPKAYLRYGDDFLLFETSNEKLQSSRHETIAFITNELKLSINPKSDLILNPNHGLKFLGLKFWPSGRTLTKRNFARAKTRLQPNNIASYNGLIKQHCNYKKCKQFDWMIYEIFA